MPKSTHQISSEIEEIIEHLAKYDLHIEITPYDNKNPGVTYSIVNRRNVNQFPDEQPFTVDELLRVLKLR